MVYTFTVTDDKGAPVEGAKCNISDRLSGQRVGPLRGLRAQGGFFKDAAVGVTDADGVCEVDVLFIPYRWTVSKSGYVTATGMVSGLAINVQLESTDQPIEYWVSVHAGTGGQISIDGGSLMSTSGLFKVTEGTVLSILAVPYIDVDFQHWYQDAVNQGSENPKTFTINASTTIAAVFRGVQHLVTVGAGVGGTVTVTYNQGSALVVPGTPLYVYESHGSTIGAQATPNEGETFDYWLVNGGRSSFPNPFSGWVIDGDSTLAALFTGQAPPPPNGNGPPPPPPPPPSAPYERTIEVFDGTIKTTALEVGNRKERNVDVFMPNLVSAYLQYKIQFSKGNDPGGVLNRIMLNNDVILEERTAWRELISGYIDVTNAITDSNTFDLWHGSNLGTWADVEFNISLVLYYSEKPPPSCPFPVLPRLDVGMGMLGELKGPLSGAPILCGVWKALFWRENRLINLGLVESIVDKE